MNIHQVGYFVGSALFFVAPPELRLSEIPFSDLPHYIYGYDAAYPPAAEALDRGLHPVRKGPDHRRG